MTPIESGVAFAPLAAAFVGASLLGPRVGSARIDRLPVRGGIAIALGMSTSIAALAVSTRSSRG